MSWCYNYKSPGPNERSTAANTKSANQMMSPANNVHQNLPSFWAVLDAAKPDKLYWKIFAAGYRVEIFALQLTVYS